MYSLTKPTPFFHHLRPPTIISRSFQSPSEDTYAKLIDACAQDHSFHRAKLLHAHLIVNGLLTHLTHFAAKFINIYVQTKQLPYARKLFDKIPKPSPRRWILLIGAYSRHGFFQEALDAFSEMQKQRVRHNQFVIPSVLKACGRVHDVQTGRVLHSVILRCKFESDVFVISALIDMYCRCGQVEVARRVFDRMVEKDLVALNALVSGYAHHGLAAEGFALVEEMKDLGVKPNVLTWNSLISGFAQKGDEVMTSKMFELMRSDGLRPDVVSWTSVISGLVQNFRNEEAFGTFKRMLGDGFYPSSATISGLLPACANVGNVKHGREIHGYAVMIGVENDVYVRSALVDMYAKSGFISEARLLFSTMHERNTVTWNSMIFGYANHGYCNEAIELFDQMEKAEGSKLDHLTFTAILTACSHAGMVELGRSLFLLMQDKYKIVPRLEHYACIVDLLGKAGNLAEAYDMIRTMPIEPDYFVWGALLGACRSHGDVDLGEIAARYLAKLEPENAGNNLLLSSLYADAGSWENVARSKKMMKRKKSKNFPGCSWIEAT